MACTGGNATVENIAVENTTAKINKTKTTRVENSNKVEQSNVLSLAKWQGSYQDQAE